MMPLERRNEPLLLRQFRKTYPSYRLNGMMRKRYEELMDAQAFNNWLQNRQLGAEGAQYADEVGRAEQVVNRCVPQLRWAGAERSSVLRAGRQFERNTERLAAR
jgi:hypothetical protein